MLTEIPVLQFVRPLECHVEDDRGVGPAIPAKLYREAKAFIDLRHIKEVRVVCTHYAVHEDVCNGHAGRMFGQLFSHPSLDNIIFQPSVLSNADVVKLLQPRPLKIITMDDGTTLVSSIDALARRGAELDTPCPRRLIDALVV